MESDQNEIHNQHRQQLEKHVYYVLALAVSALGFTIYLTIGQPLQYSQIPLGLSVIAWGMSIYCGLQYNKLIIGALYTNNQYYETQSGRNPKAGTDPRKIAATIAGIKKYIEKTSDKANAFFIWQGRLFYIGVILFVIWHVLEMYLKTVQL